MKDEITYWLEGLDDLSFNKVLDYITNLKQENERIEKEYKSKVDEIGKLISRIYKAIEYIKNSLIPYGDEWHWDDAYIRDYVVELLNLLQNGGKE